MNGNNFARLTGTKRNLLALLASSAMLTAGCSNMATTASSVNSLTTGATIGGRVHGGNQPVSGATVNLYYAAQSIYGNATLAATTTSASDGTGSFAFIKNPINGQPSNGNTFSCAAGDPLVYVIAKGGNTLNNGTPSNNAASAFIAVYGNCNELTASNFVDMTEVTTVATMAAVQQFFNPNTESLSADGTGQEKNVIDNTPITIAQLVNAATGTAVTSTVIPAFTGNGSNGVNGVTVTATPETSKVNTLANILSACVNNASASATPCTTLFTNATPPNPALTNQPGGTTFTQATDVLQAAYFLMTNPGNGNATNLQNIYNLAPAVGAPYQPSLTSQPSDWTIAINYSSSSVCGSSNGNFIGHPYDISIDSSDDIWLANSDASNGNLAEISATGAPITCVFLSGGSNGGATIDTSGNVWLASTSANAIYRYSTGINSGGLPQGSLTFTAGAPTIGVTADGLGNVYFTTAASNGSLYQIPGASTATTAVTPVQIAQNVGSNPIRLMPDFLGTTTASDIWVTSGDTYVSRVAPATSGPNLLNGYSTTTFTTGANTYGLAITNGNNVFVSSIGADNNVTYLTGSGTNYSIPSGWPVAAGFAGVNTPTALSVDGRQNVWIPNNTNVSSGVGSASEISAGAVALSPTASGFQKSTAFLSSGTASVVDQAGNVWIVGTGSAGNVTEIVGAGVPIYQPYAKGLANGRFQSIP